MSYNTLTMQPYLKEDCVVKECQGKDSQKELSNCNYHEPKNLVSFNYLEYEDVNGRIVDEQSRVTHIVLEKFQSQQKYLSSNSNMNTLGDQGCAPLDPELEE